MKQTLKKLLLGLSPAEFKGLQYALHHADVARETIREYGIDKKTFCAEVSIKPSSYKEYVSGCYNYTLRDIACLEAYKIRLASARTAEEEAKNKLFKIAGA